jgi:hypothetical protein
VWQVNVMNNDNFIFEVDDAETSLQKKEHVIQELNTACIARLEFIGTLQKEAADLREQIQRESSLRFQLERSVKRLLNIRS